MDQESRIDHLLDESRLFQPQPEFQAKAHVSSMVDYQKTWQRSVGDYEGFWDEQAKSSLDWHQAYQQVLDWQPPYAKWFVGGKLNACYNCVDRHVKNGLGQKTALIWEGEPGDARKVSYAELLDEVSRCGNALKSLGVKPGDRVSIYMPMTPELVAAVLACARIGAVHSVVFAGFSAESLAERNQDAGAKLLITADGLWRRGEILNLKELVDEALQDSPTIERCLVLKRTGEKVSMQEGRDVWWHDVVNQASNECPPEWVDSEHPLFILYTSGSTGKPKGILHTTAGYLLGTAYTSRLIFDLKEEDIFWCTADIGWVTGHSYVTYGPLANAATVLIYEGAPNAPDPSRFWQLIEKYRVSIFYTAPTAIRSFMKWGDEWLEKSDLSSLRLLGTVGEPINPKAWLWYREKVGGNRCPIVDTWWQTETGCIMIAPLPGATPTTPGTATKPFFGIDADIVDKSGRSLGPNQGGYLVVRKPWPSMLRTIWGNPERYEAAYWNHVPGCYFSGDGARRDEHGNFWIMGRIDDVLNVSGHRLSTMEIESALVSHESVAEAAVVAKPDDLKGQAIACFVVLKQSQQVSDALKKDLREHVAHHIGAIAKPDEIRFTDSLPKTRSGKIMRRLLRDIVAGRESSGDLTTLDDRGVLESLRESEDGST
ncbi:MAG: acetate--CoA ligase [Oligoflexus sp.]